MVTDLPLALWLLVARPLAGGVCWRRDKVRTSELQWRDVAWHCETGLF